MVQLEHLIANDSSIHAVLLEVSLEVVRNVLRLIDLIPYFIPYLLGAILMWTSDMKQRLGDRVAHTVVIKA